MGIEAAIRLAASVVDVAGVAAIVLGIAFATVGFLARGRREGFGAAWSGYRRGLGRAILLGLEILVAADIIRTVAIRPTLRGVAALGLLVLIRTFLSLSIEVEMEGRWPWRRGEQKGGEPGG